MDYLRAVAQAAHSTSAVEMTQARLLAADAKARIVVYGASDVVEALAKFEETGAHLANKESFDVFLVLAKAMRGASEATELRSIELVLFGPGRDGPRSPAQALPPRASAPAAVLANEPAVDSRHEPEEK